MTPQRFAGVVKEQRVYRPPLLDYPCRGPPCRGTPGGPLFLKPDATRGVGVGGYPRRTKISSSDAEKWQRGPKICKKSQKIAKIGLNRDPGRRGGPVFSKNPEKWQKTGFPGKTPEKALFGGVPTSILYHKWAKSAPREGGSRGGVRGVPGRGGPGQGG